MLMVWKVIWHRLMARLRAPHGPGGKYTPLRLAVMVRTDMERLGGLWIKAAQIMAMRRDVFPKVFCDELSKLHDRATGFSGDVARQIIEEEIGCPVDEVFREFDVVPIAAASIGQVHVARLRETNTKVAIKVQRPSIAESLKKDLAIIAGYLSLLRWFPSLSWMNLDEMYQKLEGTLADELDYRMEAGAMRRMRRTLRQAKVYAPKAFSQYCTKRILVMEFVDGVLMSDYIEALVNDPKKAKRWRRENNIRPKKLGERLYLSYLKQLLTDNLSHGDLHPGNIMMLRNNRIALIDFGSIAVLDKGWLSKYVLSLRTLAARDFSKYVDIYLTMLAGIPNIDIEAMRKEVVRELETWEAISDVKGIPYEQRSLLGGVSRLTAIFGKYQLPPIWTSLRVMRSGAALDASLKYLIPEADWFKLARKHFAREQRYMLKFMASNQSRQALAGSINDLMRLPANLGENLIFQGELIRKRAMSFQAQLSKAAAVAKAAFTTLLNIGLIATVFVVARYLTKQHDVGRKAISALPLRDVFGSMPQFAPGVWILIIILSLYLLRSIAKLVKLLGVKGTGTNPWV
ncbi:AarF/UbiB family protein [Polyangium sp. y55x31]|uniref:ABC1 kinase family protein n=1 Tax=Polyangium sp. y55x31 TaxID=3042688 RepID=UPI0024825480|nr:AarF/UbiB family protein [Polyangium sp. y55x31]MDI1475034.1 AarF/UbiB family protein [Polyangium sp. y55x31]